MASSPRRKRLVWATVTALSICALLPETGPWARRTMTATVRAVVCPPIPNDGSDDIAYWTQRAREFRQQTERDQNVAAQMPTDFPIHLVACIDSIPDDYADFKINADGTLRPFAETEYETYPENRDERIAQKLRSLAPRFDQNPSYHASVLRYLSFDTLLRLNNRGDEAILYDALRANAILSQVNSAPPSPETVADWHEAARAGERLEPRNAFFPFMDAVAFFAERRDSDALAALHRAGAKTEYNDHALEEADGYTRLRAAAGEPQTAFQRLNGLHFVRLPHYALLRACARLAVAKAVEAELQNRTEDGFRIRRDVRRIGSNLRQNAPTAIGSQVGSSIAYTTSARPGGAPVKSQTDAGRAGVPGYGPEDIPPSTSVTDPNSKFAANEKFYQAYLRRIGHANEAQAFAFEVAEQKNNQRLFEQTDENPAYYFYVPRLLWLVFAPLFGPLLLLNALFLLLLGGLSALLARTQRIANDVPLPRPVHAGIASAIFVPLGGTLLGVGVDTFWAWAGPELALACVASCGFLLGLVRYLRARRVRLASPRDPRDPVFKRAAAFVSRCRIAGARGVAQTVGLWALGLICTYLAAAFLGYAGYWIVAVAQNSVGDLGLLGIDDYAYQTHECTIFWALAACVLCTPTLLLLFFAACSPKVGVPALVGMVRGMRGVAVPVACGLVLLTVPLFVWLARADANLNRDIAGPCKTKTATSRRFPVSRGRFTLRLSLSSFAARPHSAGRLRVNRLRGSCRASCAAQSLRQQTRLWYRQSLRGRSAQKLPAFATCFLCRCPFCFCVGAISATSADRRAARAERGRRRRAGAMVKGAQWLFVLRRPAVCLDDFGQPLSE